MTVGVKAEGMIPLFFTPLTRASFSYTALQQQECSMQQAVVFFESGEVCEILRKTMTKGLSCQSPQESS